LQDDMRFLGSRAAVVAASVAFVVRPIGASTVVSPAGSVTAVSVAITTTVAAPTVATTAGIAVGSADTIGAAYAYAGKPRRSEATPNGSTAAESAAAFTAKSPAMADSAPLAIN
jgi:hypothetical protein